MHRICRTILASRTWHIASKCLLVALRGKAQGLVLECCIMLLHDQEHNMRLQCWHGSSRAPRLLQPHQGRLYQSQRGSVCVCQRVRNTKRLKTPLEVRCLLNIGLMHARFMPRKKAAHDVLLLLLRCQRAGAGNERGAKTPGIHQSLLEWQAIEVSARLQGEWTHRASACLAPNLADAFTRLR